MIETGPYRVLRHPSYTGIILAGIGIGLASANWADLGRPVAPDLSRPWLWRIHVEEKGAESMTSC